MLVIEKVVAALHNSFFSHWNGKGNSPDDPSERNPVFLLPNLEQYITASAMEDKKQQAKPNSNFCLGDYCSFLLWDCIPQKLIWRGRHLFFTFLVKWQQIISISRSFSDLMQTDIHSGKSRNCGRLTLAFLLSDCYPLTGLVCPLYPSLSLSV